MLWSYSGFLLAYITSMMFARPDKTQTCLRPRNKTVYTCEANQMIHVISRLYQEASEDCQVPNDACEVTENSLSNGFTTECNGKVTCTEDVALLPMNKTCGNVQTAMVTTSYDCISDPPVNVCSTISPSLGSHTLYLISPNFPENSNAGNIDSVCECSIKGTDMSVEILEIKFQFFQSIRANLTLTGDISSWESYPNTFLMYNLKLIFKTNSLHVEFNAYNRNSQRMWIRVNGTSKIMTTCNHVASPATSPLPIASAPTSVAITSGTPVKSTESNTVAVAVGCVFAVLVVAAITIVVIVILMRRNLRSQDDERSMKKIETLQTNSVSKEKPGNDHGALSSEYTDVEPLSSRKTDRAGDTKVLNSKSSRTSSGSHYAEITPMQTTQTGNRNHQPTPHYFILEPKPYGGHSSNLAGASQVPAGSVYSEPDTQAIGISKSYAVQKTNRGRVSDTMKTPEAGMKEETQSKSETDAGSKVQCGPGKGANTSSDGTDSGDKLVMVNNVLYQGTGGHVQSRTGTNSKVPFGPGKDTNTSADDSDDKPIMVPNVLYEGTGVDPNTRNGVLDSTHGKSSHQVPKESEYEDVKDDRRSSSRLLICDTQAGGPSPYEEIVI